MAKKGLTHEDIMNAAVALVEEKGYDNFSLRELASRLDVKPASLYNHVKGIEEINTEVALRVSDKLNQVLTNAIAGKPKDEAFMDAVRAYRQFALENPGIYQALIKMPTSSDEQIVKVALGSFAPLRNLVKSYQAGHDETIHFVRALRSVMHGFVELCNSGFMQRGGISRDISYEIVMQCYLDKLKEISGHQD